MYSRISDTPYTSDISNAEMAVIQNVFHGENWKSDKQILTEFGFTLSEVLDFKNFSNTPDFRIYFEKPFKGNPTLIGFTLEDWKGMLDESRFGLKLWLETRDINWIQENKRPIPNFNYQLFYDLGFTHPEIKDIKKYIDIPNLGVDENGLIQGLTVDEIRKALVEYRQRESYFKAQLKH